MVCIADAHHVLLDTLSAGSAPATRRPDTGLASSLFQMGGGEPRMCLASSAPGWTLHPAPPDPPLAMRMAPEPRSTVRRRRPAERDPTATRAQPARPVDAPPLRRH